MRRHRRRHPGDGRSCGRTNPLVPPRRLHLRKRPQHGGIVPPRSGRALRRPRSGLPPRHRPSGGQIPLDLEGRPLPRAPFEPARGADHTTVFPDRQAPSARRTLSSPRHRPRRDGGRAHRAPLGAVVPAQRCRPLSLRGLRRRPDAARHAFCPTAALRLGTDLWEFHPRCAEKGAPAQDGARAPCDQTGVCSRGRDGALD